jgi:flavin reductase (DIM6/NTAB) family NADH-FMN oxidoreductase RutF
VAGTDPVTLLFCTSIPVTTSNKKDTLLNIEDVPEFVVNITNAETAEAMNLTATVLPREQSEFEWAGLTPAPSRTIQVPRVAEAPISFECKLQRIVMVNDQPGGGAVVFGEVQSIHIRDDVYNDGAFDLEAFKPIGRLGGIDYVRVTSTFQMKRVPPPGK